MLEKVGKLKGVRQATRAALLTFADLSARRPSPGISEKSTFSCQSTAVPWFR